MSNKIPSVSHLLFDIYTLFHTKKSFSTPSKLHGKIVEKYKLRDFIHKLYKDNLSYDIEFVYIMVKHFKNFLKNTGLLEQGDYKADYTEKTFTIDFFRKNPHYSIALINMLFDYTFEVEFERNLDKQLLIKLIDYEFKEINKLIGQSKQNATLIDDGTLFSESNSQDLFLIALKEDLLKILNFDPLATSKPISVIINREEPEIDIKEQLLQRVKQLDPTQFEQFSLYLIATITKEKNEDIRNLITHNGQVGDGGIDGILKVKGTLNSYDTYLIQCKRYDKTSIGRPELQTFVGAMVGHNATHGIFITTSSFTKGALEFVQNVKFFSIKTMDGKSLVNYMLEHKIGITEKTQTIQTIDIPFFQQFSL